MKIMIIGDRSVGKTLLIRHLLGCKRTIPTIGFQVVHTDNVDIYDTSGDETYRSILSLYYPTIKHFVLVYKDLKTVSKYEYLRKYGTQWTLLHNSDTVDDGEEYAKLHDMNFIRSNLLHSNEAFHRIMSMKMYKGWRYCWFY